MTSVSSGQWVRRKDDTSLAYARRQRIRIALEALEDLGESERHPYPIGDLRKDYESA